MVSGEERKLSKLQKQILVLALENKEREGRSFGMKDGADVYYSEILAKVYHFPLRKDYGGRGPREMPCCCIYSTKQIGAKRYRSAQAAISRAVLRLNCRNLATWVSSARSTWSGCSLTPDGVAAARGLAQAVSLAPNEDDAAKRKRGQAGKPKGTGCQEARRIRSVLVLFYDSECQYCGKICADQELEIDHIRPLSRGGKDVLENYTVACVWCNVRKRSLELPEPGISLLLARARQFAERSRAKSLIETE